VTALDPFVLATRQIELDRARTAAFPELGVRKTERMRASPLAFLRGSAPLFYEMLANSPELNSGPSNTGYLVGDAHLENFGAFAPERERGEDTEKLCATFDLNDFDEAVLGPLRWDVLRLSTSILLGGRELGQPGARVIELSRLIIDSYAATAFEGAELPGRPRVVDELIDQSTKRSRIELLEARTISAGKKRQFQLGPRYFRLPTSYDEPVRRAFALYVDGLDPALRPKAAQLEIVDFAFRVAGTGSLGALRVAVLTTGKGGADGGFVFDMKEQLDPSPARALLMPPGPRADVTVAACRACLVHPPRLLGSSELDAPDGRKLTLVVRRLTPQEDKLDLAQLKSAELEPLARYLGGLLGRAHRRGASESGAGWSAREKADLLERAVACAGLHEATYLAFCLLTAP